MTTRQSYEERMLRKYDKFLYKCTWKYCKEAENIEDIYQEIRLYFIEWLRDTCKISMNLSGNDCMEFEYLIRDHLREGRVRKIGIGLREHKTANKYALSVASSSPDIIQMCESAIPDDYGIEKNDFISTLLPREQNIVRLLMDGYDETEAAESLNRGYRSVKRDVNHIKQKYNQYFGGVAS